MVYTFYTIVTSFLISQKYFHSVLSSLPGVEAIKTNKTDKTFRHSSRVN